MFATGSVDQTGTYVFGVLPEGVSQSRGKESPFWTVANGFDTRLALWNPTNQAQDLLVTLYYGDGSGKYKLPVHLDGQASVLIDLAQLMAAPQPDPEGNVIPANASDGSPSADGWIKMDNVPVMGRVVVIDRRRASTTFPRFS